MNQILSVDNNDSNDSYGSNNYNNLNNYNKKRGKKMEIKIVVILFCIILIIFGGFIIVNGIRLISDNSAAEQSNDNQAGQVASNEYPDISIEVVSETERNIIITHNKIIKMVKYYWNDEEPTEQEGNGNKNFEISKIEVPPGTNKLTIIVIDEDDNEKEDTREIESPERPWIRLSSEQNAIKIQIESKTNIAYVTYYWDDQEPKKYTINNKKTQRTLEIKDSGEHTLTITAVDVEGREATKTQKIKGVRAPEVKVTTDGQNFIIRASDEEEIDRIVVNLNGNESEKTINQSQYEGKIKAVDGENRLIVTVYNKSGIKKQAKIKWTKE